MPIPYLHIYFYLATKKQAAYKQAIRGPTALSPLRGTRDKCLAQWHYTAAAGRFERGTSRLRVCGLIR